MVKKNQSGFKKAKATEAGLSGKKYNAGSLT